MLFRSGLCRLPAGGAEEMAARSVWFCRAAVVIFDGEVPEVFTVGRLPCPCSRFFGAAGRGFPSPETEVRRLRVLNKLDLQVEWSKATKLALQDGGSSEPRVGDFPAAEGLRPFQGVCGAVAAARRRHVLQVVGGVEVQKDLDVFSLFFLDCSVRTLL